MSRVLRRPLVFASSVVLALVGCSGGDGGGGDETYSRDKLLDPATCKECHQDHYKEWSGSMHAYAAKDPIFLAMNERGQKETNGELGNFCVSCHAPMAVREHETEDGTNLSTVPEAFQGITCYFCHQVTEVQGTHNNPLVLANDTTMRGPVSNPVKYKAHGAEYSKLHDGNLLDSSKLCGACHDIVVPAHFSGATADVALERTYAEWQASSFNDPKHRFSARSCNQCHFRPIPNSPIASPENPTKTMPTNRFRHVHEFPAIDTALVDGFPEADRQLQSIQETLDVIAFRVQICVGVSNAGDIQVTLENLSAGHRLPSGASQDRRIWLELHAYQKDQSGTEHEYCRSGVVPSGIAVTTLPPVTPGSGTLDTWLLRDVTTKADGTTPAHMFWDVANVESHTIPVSLLSDPNTPHVSGKNYDPIQCAGKLVKPDHVTATVWIEPVGLDVFDDMTAAGHTVKDATGADLRAKMPRYAVLPNRGSTTAANPDVTLEWTPELETDGCTQTSAATSTPPPSP